MKKSKNAPVAAPVTNNTPVAAPVVEEEPAYEITAGDKALFNSVVPGWSSMDVCEQDAALASIDTLDAWEKIELEMYYAEKDAKNALASGDGAAH